jgi:hypothetical protein
VESTVPFQQQGRDVENVGGVGTRAQQESQELHVAECRGAETLEALAGSICGLEESFQAL